MKSIIKAKILGVDYYTLEKVYITKTMTVEGVNFVDKVLPAVKINNGKHELPETILTAKKQADEWLASRSDILNSIIFDPTQELNFIIDWEIISIKNIGLDNSRSVVFAKPSKKPKISEIEKIGIILNTLQEENKEFELSEELKNGFLHTYHEMKDSLIGLSIDKKIIIVFKAMGVGLKASTNAYDKIIELYKSYDKEQTKNEKLSLPSDYVDMSKVTINGNNPK